MKTKFGAIVAVVLGVSLCWLPGRAYAQLPIPGSSQFDLTGFLQAASVTAAADAHSGGSLTVNGHVVIVPRETIVILPASALTWQELFALAPAPYTGVATGMAMSDIPAPITTYEVNVIGNRVGDQYIAGLITISQNGLNSGAGFINYMDYSIGEMRVGGLMGNAASGARVQINDPLIAALGTGRYGRAMSPDVRFMVDQDNPTIASATGFPMCFPRTRVDQGIDDPLCPQSNRPLAVAPAIGFASLVQMNNPALAGNPPPDARNQAPLEVGDYVTYAGTLELDANGVYVSAHTITNNVAIFTWPGTNPAYVRVEVSLIGTGGLTVLGAGEAAFRTRFEGMTTDPSRNVHLYGIDLNPLTGATSDRDWGTIGVDPGPGGGIGAVKGRWRFRPPCTAAVATDKACTPPPGGTFLPPTREMRAVIEGQQSQVPGALGALTSANGIYYGQYHAPIGEYIFPENIPGTPIVENNFNSIDFLAKGGYTSWVGTLVGQLNPWPSDVIPSASCTAPTANAGGPYTVASGGVVSLAGSASGTGPFSYAWSAPTLGTLSSNSAASPSYTASFVGVQSSEVLTLTVTGSCGSGSANVSITINAVAAPTVNPIAAQTVFSNTLVTMTATGSDPNGLALTFSWLQTGGPIVLVPNPKAGATQTFTRALPIGQVASDVLTFSVIATNSLGVSSAAGTTSVTVKPLPDAISITSAVYRTSQFRLAITATSSVVSANVILKLRPYLTATGVMFDPSILGNTFVNNNNGTYTLTLVGAPEPAVPPATPLIVFSNLGGSSVPSALTLVRQ